MTTTCPASTNGRHDWESFTIPTRQHHADGGTVTTVTEIKARQCWACETVTYTDTEGDSE